MEKAASPSESRGSGHLQSLYREEERSISQVAAIRFNLLMIATVATENAALIHAGFAKGTTR
jgi:hypothetical protein